MAIVLLSTAGWLILGSLHTDPLASELVLSETARDRHGEPWHGESVGDRNLVASTAGVSEHLLELIDDVTGQPVSATDCTLVSTGGQRTKATSDSEGKLRLTADLAAVRHVLVEGYYAGSLQSADRGVVRLQPYQVVRGFVDSVAWLEPEDLRVRVDPEEAPLEQVAYSSVAVRPDLTFEFRPQALVRHRLELVGARGGVVGSLAAARWSPGQAVVRIAIEGVGVALQPCNVRVTVHVSSALAEDVESRKVLATASGRELSALFDRLRVRMLSRKGSIAFGSVSLEPGPRTVSGEVPGPEFYVVEVACGGIGLHRRYGPFLVDRDTREIECKLADGARLDVDITGFSESDLSKSPVSVVLRDHAGRLLQVGYADDGARDRATVTLLHLPRESMRVSLWGMARGLAARPAVLAWNGESVSTALALSRSVRVHLDYADVAHAVERLRIVDPVSEAVYELPPGRSGRGVVDLAAGSWVVRMDLSGKEALAVPFEALGESVTVRIP